MFFVKVSAWYKEQTSERKASAIFFVLLFLTLFGYTVYSNIRRHQLSKRGVYYAARIYKITSSKSSKHYFIEYNFKNKQYSADFKPDFLFKPNRENAYVYIRLLPEKPSVCQYLDEGEVTDSLVQTMPKEGWKKLPDYPRVYLLKGNYIQYK